MKNLKKIFFVFSVLIIFSLTGCGSEKKESSFLNIDVVNPRGASSFFLQHKKKYSLKLDVKINKITERNESLDFVYLENYDISASYEYEFDNEGNLEVKIDIADETGNIVAYGSGATVINRGKTSLLSVYIQENSLKTAPQISENDWSSLRKKYEIISDTEKFYLKKFSE